MTLLSVQNIAVNYGQLNALRDVSLNLDEGRTLFITGPNGAGKSTLLKVIAGTVRARAGAPCTPTTIPSLAPAPPAPPGHR